MTERAIFLEALDKPSPAERAAYLDTTCGGDTRLRERVEALLLCHERAGEFLGRPAPERLAEVMAGPAADDTQTVTTKDEIENDLPFLAPSADPAALGRLGHYEVREVVGRGGMGVVLRAFDETLHRVVAIKVMAPQLATSATARRRFVREARAAAAVAHDHVVTVHAVEEAGGLPYLVMHFVNGQSLQERLDRSGPLQVAEVLRIGMQAARGLAAAHAQGLVHRDVKPANILLENGVERVKLTDFGLARAADDASLTQSGAVAGTPAYMSPEQARGEAADHRSDLFSLGSVLYAMCVGRPPFRASNALAVLKRVCEETPTPVCQANPEVPSSLAEVIERLHAKDPAARYQTASEVADVLGRGLADLQRVAVVPVGMPVPPAVAPRSHRRRWASVATVLLLLTAGLGLAEAAGVTKVRATVVRVFTPDGVLVVEVDDPDVKVTIEGDGGLVVTGAGLQEVRLKPGSYKVQADKDGRPVRLDQELITISSRGKQIVRVRLEGAPAAIAVPNAGSGVFVVLGGQGDAERAFETLTRAVQGAADGDTIEIRGNGPFVTEPLNFDRRALVIRAGAGFRPVLSLNEIGVQSRATIIATQAALVLEGLDFVLLSPTPPPPNNGKGKFLSAGQAPLYVANCRFAATVHDYSDCISSRASTMVVRNCEFLRPASVPIHFYPRSRTQCHIDNCVHAGVQILVLHDSGDNDAEIRLTHNTLISPACPLIHFGHVAAPTKPLRVVASSNVIVTSRIWHIVPTMNADKLLPPAEAEAATRRALAWQGRENLYAVTDFMQWHDRGPLHGPESLAEWKKYWDPSDADAQGGQVRYQGGDLPAQLAEACQLVDGRSLPLGKITPNDFRLRPDSAGYRAGKDGKDLGADVDLVGPGPAYERWKKTPEYLQWRLDSGQATGRLAITEPAAFVILGAQGVEVRKCDTLADAVAKARSHDTIEIRGNGPFRTDPIEPGAKALAIRAGTGYAPVIKPTYAAVKAKGALLNIKAALTLEGLELHHEGMPTAAEGEFVERILIAAHSAPLHVTNCTLIVSPGKQGQSTAIASLNAHGQIRNSLVVSSSYGLQIYNTPGVHWTVEDCLIVTAAGSAVLLSPDAQNSPGTTVQFTRNTVASNAVVTLSGPADELAAQLRDAPAVPVTPVVIESDANVWQLWRVFSLNCVTPKSPQGLPVDEQRRAVSKLVRWQDRNTIYGLGDEPFLNLHAPTTGLLKDLAEWNTFWRLKDTGSREGAVHLRGYLKGLVADNPTTITPNDFRLRPDSAGYGCGKDGKHLGADVDLVGPGDAYVRFKKSAGYQQWVQISGQVKTLPAITEPGAFVVLAGKGAPGGKFDNLQAAIAAAGDGDVIEVRGNGPFHSERIKMGNAALVIRAGIGFRPVLKIGPDPEESEGPLVQTRGPLVIEGLELRRRGRPGPGRIHSEYISASGRALHVANCRFCPDELGTRLYYGIGAGRDTLCEVRNCEFLNAAEVSVRSEGKRLVLENCLHLGRLLLTTDADEQRLNHNTVVTDSQIVHGAMASPGAFKKDPPKRVVGIVATGNILNAGVLIYFNFFDPPSDAVPFGVVESLVPQVLSWKGRENLYHPISHWLTWHRVSQVRPSLGPRDLAGWKKLWGSPEAGSIEGVPRYKGGDLMSRRLAAPSEITPDDFRLIKDSPGYRAGKDGKDLGADVDLVGPGPAYEKWKKTPAYPQWLKDTGQQK